MIARTAKVMPCGPVSIVQQPPFPKERQAPGRASAGRSAAVTSSFPIPATALAGPRKVRTAPLQRARPGYWPKRTGAYEAGRRVARCAPAVEPPRKHIGRARLQQEPAATSTRPRVASAKKRLVRAV